MNRRNFIRQFTMLTLGTILTVSSAEAGRGVAGFYAIPWQVGGPEQVLGPEMRDALFERGFGAEEFAFFWEAQRSDTPIVTVERVFDYTCDLSFHTFTFASHANPEIWVPEYYVSTGARDARMNYYLSESAGPRYDPSWVVARDGDPAPRIAIHAAGFAGAVQPSIDPTALVHLGGCHTWDLRDDLLGNLGAGGQTFVGYDKSLQSNILWNNMEVWAEGLTCQRWPGLNNGAGAIATKMTFAKIDGDPEGRILPGVDCHNWAGTVLWQGVTPDKRLLFAILNDGGSHYTVNGYTSFADLDRPVAVARFAGLEGPHVRMGIDDDGEPAAAARLAGVSEDGFGKLRVYSLPSSSLGDYVAFTITEEDRFGRESTFPMFSSAPQDVPTSWTGFLASEGEWDVSEIVDPVDVSEIRVWQWANRELVPRNLLAGSIPAFETPSPLAGGGCDDCADVVVLGDDVQILDVVAAQAATGHTESGQPLKVLAFLASPDAELYRDILQIVHQENIAEGTGRYPVNPGPLLQLAGDVGITGLDTYEDDPDAPACQQPICRGVTGIGDIYRDGTLICPVSVVPAETPNEAQTAMLFANDWNAKRYVRSDNRLLAVSGNRADGEEYPALGQTLREDVMIWWQSDTLQVLEETNYGPLAVAEMRADGCESINLGIAYLWAMGLYTGVNSLSYFVSGSDFPQVPLTTRQRIAVFAPTCWSGATWWESFYGPSIVRKVMCLANTNGTGAAFFVGHDNGGYGFMHEWAAKILARHFALASAGRVAQLVFFEAVKEIEAIDPVYARGLVFYGGYVKWHGLDSAATAPEEAALIDDAMRLDAIPRSPGVVEFRFRLLDPSDAEIDIVDVGGRRVDTIDAGGRSAGEHSVEWSPVGVASGVYFGSLRAAGGTASDKFVLTR